jgi:hypothetical protein
MATVIRLVKAKYIENTQTDQYTAPGTVLIDTCTVTNVGASDATFSANLLPISVAAGADNRVLSGRVLAPGQTYHCPELMGKVLYQNEKLSTLASAANTLVLDVTGRVIA